MKRKVFFVCLMISLSFVLSSYSGQSIDDFIYQQNMGKNNPGGSEDDSSTETPTTPPETPTTPPKTPTTPPNTETPTTPPNTETPTTPPNTVNPESPTNPETPTTNPDSQEPENNDETPSTEAEESQEDCGPSQEEIEAQERAEKEKALDEKTTGITNLVEEVESSEETVPTQTEPSPSPESLNT